MVEEEKQWSSKQHPVPQHIMGVEFKLVGNLTIRQFLWVGGGAILAYLVYRAPLPSPWPYILGGGTALLGLALAFLPVQDQGLEKWIRNFIVAVASPTQRVWKKSESLPELFLTEYKTPTPRAAAPPKDRARLEQYLKTLGKKESPKSEDETTLKEKRFLKRLGFEPLAGPPASLPPAAPLSPTYRPSFQKEGGGKAAPRSTLASEINYALQPVISIPIGGKTRLVSSIRNIRPGRRLHTLAKTGRTSLPVKGELIVETRPKETTRPAGAKAGPPVIPPERREKEIKKQIEEIGQRIRQLKKEAAPARASAPKPHPPAAGAPPPPPPTKDSGGLEDSRRKLEEERKKLEEINLRYQTKINELKNQNSRLTTEIKNIQKEVEELRTYTSEVTAKNEVYNRRLKEQEARLRELAKEKGKTEETLRKLQGELGAARTKFSGKAEAMKKSVEERIFIPKAVPKTHLSPIIKDIPNVINGVVKDKDGRLLEGVVVIVKDDQGEPVRALKTNELGQFIITTPLPNGRYTVELEKAGQHFDIITVDVLGNVLGPIEFIGHD